MKMLREFCRNRGGNFALLSALLVVVLFWAAGIAVDVSNASRAKVTVQGIVDATVLNATRDIVERGVSNEAAEVAARLFFDAELSQHKLDFSVNSFNLFPVENGEFSLHVQGEMPTSILKVVGQSNIPVAITAGATMGVGNVEIAIAFDTTGSMGFGTSWSDAIQIMQRSLDAIKEKSAGLALTFIPFTDRVNVGLARSGLLTNSDQSSVARSSWGGCVEPRTVTVEGRSKYYMNDRAANLEGRFVKFENGTRAGHETRESLACNRQSIIGPTSNVTHVTQELSKLSKGGTGRFDIGMVWAWRALSPQWKGFWEKGAPKGNGIDLANYPESADRSTKIAVLVTDGLTVAYNWEYGAKLLGFNKGSVEHFENFVSICEDMAAAGISVHVMHVNGNELAEPYFRKCAAGGGGYYKVASKQELIDAFAGVTGSGSNLRLVN